VATVTAEHPYDQVAAVLAAATPGPWVTQGRLVHGPDRGGLDIGPLIAEAWGRDGNARFIALARNTYPELLAVARAAEAWEAWHESRPNCKPGYFVVADLRAALSDLKAKIGEVMP
jgi:hypothetical protein